MVPFTGTVYGIKDLEEAGRTAVPSVHACEERRPLQDEACLTPYAPHKMLLWDTCQELLPDKTSNVLNIYRKAILNIEHST